MATLVGLDDDTSMTLTITPLELAEYGAGTTYAVRVYSRAFANNTESAQGFRSASAASDEPFDPEASSLTLEPANNRVLSNSCGSASPQVQTCQQPPDTIEIISNDWYCTNKPNISTPLDLSLAVAPGANSPSFNNISASFKTSSAFGTIYSHTTDVYFNGQSLGYGTISGGDQSLSFSVPPGALSSIAGGTSRNTLSLQSVHNNSAHYSVGGEFRLTASHNGYESQQCSAVSLQPATTPDCAVTGGGWINPVIQRPNLDLELTISDPSIDPNNLQIGQHVPVTARITNRGSADTVSPIVLSITLPEGLVPLTVSTEGETKNIFTQVIQLIALLSDQIFELFGGVNEMNIDLTEENDLSVNYTYNLEPLQAYEAQSIELDIVVQANVNGRFDITGSVITQIGQVQPEATAPVAALRGVSSIMSFSDTSCEGIAQSRLNIREFPLATLGLVHTLTQIETLTIIGKTVDNPDSAVWYRVTLNEYAGWVHSDYVVVGNSDCIATLDEFTFDIETEELTLVVRIPQIITEPEDPNLTVTCDVPLIASEESILLLITPDSNSNGRYRITDDYIVRLGAAKQTNPSDWYLVITVYTVEGNERTFYNGYGWIQAEYLNFDEAEGDCSLLPAFEVNNEGLLIVDVAITKTLLDENGQPEDINQPEPRAFGSEAQFEISIINESPMPLTGLQVSDTLPIGLIDPILVSGSDFSAVESSLNTWALDSTLSNEVELNSTELRVKTKMVLPDILPDDFDTAYLNTVTVTLDSQFLAVNTAVADITTGRLHNEAVAQILPKVCIITGTNVAIAFRAPVRGNPAEHPDIAKKYKYLGPTIVIDAMSEDPIFEGLYWAHVVNPDNLYISPADAPANFFPLNHWVMVNTNYNPNGYEGVVSLQSEQIQINQLLECRNNHQIDDWTNRFALDNNYNFPSPTTVTFTHLPISLEDICVSGVPEQWNGLGVHKHEPFYKVTKHHFGIDVFTKDAYDSTNPQNPDHDVSVYSIADGIVVGIGDGRPLDNDTQNALSQHSWGSGVQLVNGKYDQGYTVIVRVGHLYVLYGHMRDVDDNIYVGSPVIAGQRLGRLGQFQDSHIHIEVRNLYEILNNNGIVTEGNSNVIMTNDLDWPRPNTGNYNRIGILEYQPSSRGFVYDFIQFYGTSEVTDPGTKTLVSTSLGLGVIDGSIQTELTAAAKDKDGNPITLETLSRTSNLLFPTQTSCNRKHSVSDYVYLESQYIDEEHELEGFWGFKLAEDAPLDQLRNPFDVGATIPIPLP